MRRSKKARGKPQFRLTTVPRVKAKKAMKKQPVEKEAPQGLLRENRCRHIRDNRAGRTEFSLCGMRRDDDVDRPPLDPTVSDDLDYLIEKMRGCQKCLRIWISRFM
jgi:hypothetical protein